MATSDEPSDPSSADKDSVGLQLAKAGAPPEPKDKLDEDRRRVGVARAHVDLRLSKILGYGALSLMGVQLLIADTAFFLYGFNNDWKIPAAAIDAWLAAAVIQVIGVVLVITKYLFPSDHDGN